ncbi:hypothetical protein ACJX0J_006836, partial [Zea mays]
MPLGFYMLACLIWLFLEKRTIDDTILLNIGFYIVVILLFLAFFLYLQYYYTLAFQFFPTLCTNLWINSFHFSCDTVHDCFIIFKSFINNSSQQCLLDFFSQMHFSFILWYSFTCDMV